MAAVKNMPPIGYFQLLGAGKSGWILKGTEKTANPVELTFPESRNILNHGFRKKFKEVENPDGSKYKSWDLEEVQFIARCPTFLKREQEERNIKPHRSVHDANLDWITFKNGDLTVTREGQFEVLYDFLMEGTSQNIDNPNRIETADEVFRAVRTR